MSDMIRKITSFAYQAVPEVRAEADALLAEAGLEPTEVADIEIYNDHVIFNRYLLDSNGKKFLGPDDQMAMEKVLMERKNDNG